MAKMVPQGSTFRAEQLKLLGEKYAEMQQDIGFREMQTEEQQSALAARSSALAKAFPLLPQFSESILECMGHGVYVLDLVGRIIYVNAYFERLMGIARYDILGRNAAAAMAAPGYKETGKKLIKRLAEKCSWTGQFPVIRATGDILWTLITASPVLDEEGNMVAICCTIIELRLSLPAPNEALPTAGLESSPSVILTSSQAQVPPPPQTPPELAAPVPLEQHEEEKGGIWRFLTNLWPASKGKPTPATQTTDQQEAELPKPALPNVADGVGASTCRSFSGASNPYESGGKSAQETTSSQSSRRSSWADRVDFDRYKKQYMHLRLESLQSSRAQSTGRGDRRTEDDFPGFQTAPLSHGVSHKERLL